MAEDDFDKADKTFPIQNAEIIPPSVLDNAPKNMLEHREQLVKKYHAGSTGLAERLQKDGKSDVESLVMALVEEVIKETDNLLGNELLATHSGNLRDATIISDKRAAVLTQAIKCVQAKQLFEKEHGIDLDSPSMRIVFQFFMGKVRDTFKTLNYNDEVSDTFFRQLATSLESWKKELKEEINAMNSIGK